MISAAKDTRSALEFAKGLLPLLPGWRLDANTQRAIREGDDLRHWATLENPALPGAALSINTSHHDGRLTLSASYPTGWEPYIDGRGRVYREQITVSMSKTPEQMVRDITRRLFDGTGYLTRVAELMAKKQASDDAQTNGEALTRELAALVGGRIDATPNTWRDTPDSRRQFHHYRDGSGSSRIEVKVATGGKRADIKLDDLSATEAHELLTWWKSKGTR